MIVRNVMHKTCKELEEKQAERRARSGWKSDQRGVNWLGNLEQLCTTHVSSWTWRMGYNTQEQKNSGADNTRRKQFLLLFLFSFWVFFNFLYFFVFLSA